MTEFARNPTRPRTVINVCTHSVFGVRLESDFPLPELAETEPGGDGPLWRIATQRGDPPVESVSPTGSEIVYGEVLVHAYAAPGLLRLAFDDTGTFDVRAADRTIAWYPGPSATEAAVRADLLGRVIALAAHADGRLTLHASAVSVDGHGIAFLGPKHAGKSTLALALVRNGARLVADDAVITRFDDAGQPWAVVGVQRPRLWTDSIRALGATPSSAEGDKPTIELEPDQLAHGEVPLRACYLLRPGATTGIEISRGPRLQPVHSALALVQFSKIGGLLGGSEAPVVLERAAALAAAVPVHVIDVARAIDRLDAVAARIISWHRTGVVPNAAAAVSIAS
ncbi:MAG TPA: hypothetical protein VFZ21_03430 [Gemmatimonadaceae bacterium]|nr:hypothetical protein [Gemmatimonadaceae bacterium]